jgi:hypothetical protein
MQKPVFFDRRDDKKVEIQLAVGSGSSHHLWLQQGLQRRGEPVCRAAPNKKPAF